jgi:Carbohydrate-selective porin, OprB family
VGKNVILIAGILAGMSLLAVAAVSADEPVTNEALMKEIRGLKDTVRQQAQKIEELEKRVNSQETKSQPPANPLDTSLIDKKIDERLSQRPAPNQLMEGLTFGLEATTIVQGAHRANGDSQLSRDEDFTDATITSKISFNKKFGDYGEGFVLLKAGEGAGLDRNLKLFSDVNDNASDNSSVHMSEAWYEFYFKQFSGALTLGKLDPTDYIDTNEYANDETIQFLGGIFDNSPVIEFPVNNGGGLHFGASPCGFMDINLVAMDGKGEWDNIFDAMFLAGQINFKPKFLGKPGNYRFLAWENGTGHTKWADPAKDKENSSGYGLSFDQELTDVVGLFVRYGWQDPKVFLNGNNFSLEQSWSLGPQFKGSFWGRPNDVLGMGFGQVIPSNKYKEVNGLRALPEDHLECYYSFKLNDHFSLSPDLQVVWNPYGKDAVNGDGPIVIGGMRGQMEF